ncbi:MAG: hypothetical protein ACOYXT_25225 [Bacteroidota bacterium]
MKYADQRQQERPKRLEHDFEEMHIAMVWEELHLRFGFNIKEWKKLFLEYREKQPREMRVTGAFFRFGNQHINVLLNKILCRSSGFATWNNLCEYVMQKKR